MFNIKAMSRFATSDRGRRNQSSWYVYSTPDTAAQLQAPGYFNAAKSMLRAGDSLACIVQVEGLPVLLDLTVTAVPLIGDIGVSASGILPLPTLPLAAGALVAGHGDSQTAFNHTVVSGDNAVSTSASGPIQAALAIDPRFNFDSWFVDPAPYVAAGRWRGSNTGVAGDRFVYANQPDYGNGILARLPDCLSKNSKIVVAVCGFNTLNNGDGENTAAREAYMKIQYEALIGAVRNSGKHLILMTLYPTDLWAAGDVRYTILANVNTWIRAQAGREGLRICDPYDALAPGGVLDASLFQLDVGAHIHLSPKGALLVGRDYLLPILQSMISAGSVFEKDPAVGNLLAASVGQLIGTTGTNTSGPTGPVATGCIARRIRGTSGVANTKEQIGAGPAYKQVSTITPVVDATASHQLDFSLPVLTAGLPAPGSWIRAAVYVEHENAAAVGVCFAVLEVKDAVANAVRQNTRGNFGSFTTFGEAPNFASRARWLLTPPMQVTTETFDNLKLFISTFWDGDSTAGPIVQKISAPRIFAVPDPRPAWGF